MATLSPKRYPLTEEVCPLRVEVTSTTPSLHGPASRLSMRRDGHGGHPPPFVPKKKISRGGDGRSIGPCGRTSVMHDSCTRSSMRCNHAVDSHGMGLSIP